MRNPLRLRFAPVPQGIPDDGLAVTGGPPDGYRGQPREEPEQEVLLGGIHAGRTREEAAAAEGKRPSVVPLHSKSTSCFSWTPLQMLEEMARAIRAGEEAPEGMVILYTVRHEDGRTSVHSWRAQLGWCEEYTYLEVAQQGCLENQRQPG